MASLTCSGCGGMIHAAHLACPHCGKRFASEAADEAPAESIPSRGRLVGCTWLLFLIGVGVTYCGLVMDLQPLTHEDKEDGANIVMAGVAVWAISMLLAFFLVLSKGLTPRIHGWIVLTLGFGGVAITYLARVYA